MNQRHLEYFLEVYKRKSMKEAAAALMISVQGLSKTLISLEEELGEELFVRNPKGLIPTRAAKILKNHAQKIIEEYKLIQSKEYLSPEKKKRLKILSSADITQYLTVSFIKEFRKEYPGICLVLIETTDRFAQQLLLDEEVELAIIAGPLPDALFSHTQILSSRYVAVVNKTHPLAEKQSIDLEDLDGEPIAIRGREYSMFDTHQMFLEEYGVNFNTVIETSSYSLIHQMAEENLCIGSSLDYIAYGDPRPGTVILPHSGKEMLKHICAAWKKGRELSAEAKCFYEFLLEWIKKIETKEERQEST